MKDDTVSNERFDATFDPIFDLQDRWDFTFDDAEVFLESIGYYDGKTFKERRE
jgi:hypothetical protein